MSAVHTSRRLGLWLIGAKGNVGATVVTGLAAIAAARAPTIGLVTELDPFRHLDLTGLANIVVGGHDVRAGSLRRHAERMWKESRAIPPELLAAASVTLDEVDTRIRPGTQLTASERIKAFVNHSWVPLDTSPRTAIERLRRDIEQFREHDGLDDVVVVNIASTEPAYRRTLPPTWDELKSLLDTSTEEILPASSMYAIASFEAGASYVNFTPSLGATPQAIQQLAINRRSAHAGYDGKSGETMLKAVLAPMFAARHLKVASWVGHNILGNLDGWVLQDSDHKQPKVRSKDRLLADVLGYSPQSLVSIEYVKSMGDWKTAWNHIHFEGFLSTSMALQFTWEGCDSLLAAPLVVDLARLVDFANRNGEHGALPWLAFFFKSPLVPTPPDFAAQWDALNAWADSKRQPINSARDTPQGE